VLQASKEGQRLELREQELILKQAKSEKALAISAEERDLGILDRETDIVQRKRTLNRNGRKWRNDSKTWKNRRRI